MALQRNHNQTHNTYYQTRMELDKKKECKVDDLIARVERLMGPRQVFTPPELVKMGIYGSKSSVWRAVHLGHIEAVQVSDRRWVILKDSIIKHLKNMKMK